MVNFHVISTGYKCYETLSKCMNSVVWQDYDSELFKQTAVVDNAVAGAPNEIIEMIKHHPLTELIRTNKRHGKMKNFYDVAIRVPGDTIICDLDLDDSLHQYALSIVAKEYEANPDLLLTHGSYRMESGREARFCREYTNENFRGTRWNGSHLKTFKASLFHKIKPRDLKDKAGNWYMVCADMAMFYPIAEMAGLDRIKFIPDEIYIYNDLSDLNDHKTQPEAQKRIEMQIRRKPVYRRVK